MRSIDTHGPAARLDSTSAARTVAPRRRRGAGWSPVRTGDIERDAPAEVGSCVSPGAGGRGTAARQAARLGGGGRQAPSSEPASTTRSNCRPAAAREAAAMAHRASASVRAATGPRPDPRASTSRTTQAGSTGGGSGLGPPPGPLSAPAGPPGVGAAPPSGAARVTTWGASRHIARQSSTTRAES